jgi:hypothetical protein
MNWKIALVASALVVTGGIFSGCGGDDCTRADDKMLECMTTMTTSSSSGGMGMAEACSGAHLCHSQCINNHTCTQINGNDPGYTACMADCQGK